MMKKTPFLLFFFSLLFCTQGVQAQAIHNPNIKRTWHWAFGAVAGLDFNTGTPVVNTSRQTATGYNSFAMSDTSGNLLFYGDQGFIYNRNNAKMPNQYPSGTYIFPNGSFPGIEQMVVLQKPDSSNIYYVFGADMDTSNLHSQMEYFVVDMTKDGGLGDVVSKGNILLYSRDCEAKITAIPVKNQRAYWVITAKFRTDTFQVYRFSDSGVAPNPVISTVGKIDSNEIGYLIASHDGQKLADGFEGARIPQGGGGSIELLDFNDSTGIISNPISFPYCKTGEYLGSAFSPDDKKLYFCVQYVDDSSSYRTGNAIYQYNIAAGIPAAIIASKTLLDSVWQIDSTNMLYGFHMDLQLAPNGKIYSARNSMYSLGAINYPDSLGTACDNVDSAISLISGMSGSGLVHFISSYFYDSSLVTGTPKVQPPALTDMVSIYPNPNNGKFVIEAKSAANRVEIYNILGKKVYGKMLNHIQHDCKIDLSNQLNGIYLYRLISTTGKQIASGKFVIQKQP